MESQDYKQVALVPANPVTTRAFPVSWSVNSQETFLAYGCKTNVILRNLKDSTQSLVYTDLMNKVTSVKWNPDGNYLAVGTDNGKVRIISYNEAQKEFIVKKDHAMLNADVLSMAYTDDGQRIAAVGAGKDTFAKAVIADSGSKLGDFFGPTKNILSVDIKQKPFRAILAGEDHDIYVYDGVPFKHAKTLHGHSNFVNKVAYNKDGSQFASVSSDKTILIFDNETIELVNKFEKAHLKGIIDASWLDNDTLITCSADNTVKIWKVKDSSLDKTLLLKEGQTEASETVENQQLGLQVLSDQILTVSLNSNINVWKLSDIQNEKLVASDSIQGHTNHLTHLSMFNGHIISADLDGRVISWNKELKGQQLEGVEKLVELTFLTSNKNHIYTAGVDGILRKTSKAEGDSFTFTSSEKLDIILSLAIIEDKFVIALNSKNLISVLNADTLELVNKHEFKDGEATFLTYSHFTNEIWVGDKKGLIHILDANSFEKVNTIEKKHNHGITYMTASKDGKLIATGDSYRYIYVFNVESKDEIACFPYHTSHINHLDFNGDGSLLLTSSLDRNVGVASIETKTKKIINKPNEKDVKSAIFDEEGRVITAGYDSSIRIWSL